MKDGGVPAVFYIFYQELFACIMCTELYFYVIIAKMYNNTVFDKIQNMFFIGFSKGELIR